MLKKIIIACRGAVATSTIVANRVKKLCKENGINAEISQARICEITDNLPADLIVTTSNCAEDFEVPIVKGIPFISGLDIENTEQEILDYLQ